MINEDNIKSTFSISDKQMLEYVMDVLQNEGQRLEVEKSKYDGRS